MGSPSKRDFPQLLGGFPQLIWVKGSIHLRKLVEHFCLEGEPSKSELKSSAWEEFINYSTVSVLREEFLYWGEDFVKWEAPPKGLSRNYLEASRN